MKKNVLFMIIGLVIGISITVVYAEILYAAKDVSYKDTNVQDAIEEIYNTTPSEIIGDRIIKLVITKDYVQPERINQTQIIYT